MQWRNFFALHDALTSSALASAGYATAHFAGASEENKRAIAQTIAGIAAIGGTLQAGKTGLLPVTGSLGVPNKPGAMTETQQTNALAPAVKPSAVKDPLHSESNAGIEAVPSKPQLNGTGVLTESSPVDINLNFTSKGVGTHLRRVVDISGESIQVNSGHSYNRVHKTGDIRNSGFSMDQVDSAIVRDISSMPSFGLLQQVPHYATRTVDMGGYKIAYRVARLPKGAFRLQLTIRNDEVAMNIFECADRIKKMYRDYDTDPDRWGVALRDLNCALNDTSDPAVLERCILNDENWELPVDERISILRKAKALGASSVEFLIDYYGFLSAHLDPGVEKDETDISLAKILK